MRPRCSVFSGSRFAVVTISSIQRTAVGLANQPYLSHEMLLHPRPFWLTSHRFLLTTPTKSFGELPHQPLRRCTTLSVKYSWYSNRPVRGTARTAIARVLDAESREKSNKLNNSKTTLFCSWYLEVVVKGENNSCPQVRRPNCPGGRGVRQAPG